jgi:hypothetical protein
VLEQLTAGPRSRARMADALGLSRTSMTAIASQLLTAGVVVEQGRSRSGRRGGRPGELLAIHPDAAVAVGLDAHDDGAWIVARFLDGRVVVRESRDAAWTPDWRARLSTCHAVTPAPSWADVAHAAGQRAELAAAAESDATGLPVGFIALDDGVRIGTAVGALTTPSARPAAPPSNSHRLVREAIRRRTSAPAAAYGVLLRDIAKAVEAVLACIRVEVIAIDPSLCLLGNDFLDAVRDRAHCDVALRYATTGAAGAAAGAALIGARELPERLAAAIVCRTLPTTN